MDWGLAKVMTGSARGDTDAKETAAWTAVLSQRESDGEVTQAGSVLGTPAFMPPEQAVGAVGKVDARSDVFGLGAILAVILTGQPPFVAGSAETIRVRAAQGDVADCLSRLDECQADPGLVELCKRCLSPKMDDRPADAGAVAQAVAALRAAADERARQAELERARAEAHAQEQRKRRRVWLGAAAALTLAVVGGLAAVLAVQRRANAKLETKNAELAEANDRILDQNDQILARNDAIRKEVEAKERQRLLAESRLRQSMETAGLFANDAVAYCDDALVPGESKKELLLVLVNHLEKQVQQGADEETLDACRVKAWLYQNLAGVYENLLQIDKAGEAVNKGLEAMELWLRLSPDDPHALSHKAGLLHHKGAVLSMSGPARAREAQEYFAEALALRRQLLGDPRVDRFTPGKSREDLAVSLEQAGEYEEALKIREQTYQLIPSFRTLNDLCGTLWKMAEKAGTYERKRAYLVRADELSEQLHRMRPHSRPVLSRWAGILWALGYLEGNNHEADQRRAYARFAVVSRKLATSRDLVPSLRDYGRSFHYLGVIEEQAGNLEEARQYYALALQVREDVLRDYPDDPNELNHKIDKCFSLNALGRHQEAAELAREASKWTFFDAMFMFRVACIYDGCRTAVETARPPLELTPEDRRLQAEYDERTLVALNTVVKRKMVGYNHGQVNPNVFPRLRGEPRCEAFVEYLKEANRLPRDPAKAEHLMTLQTNPKDVPALIGLAQDLEREKEWHGAGVAWGKVAALEPKHPRHHFSRGAAHYEAKEFEEALTSLHEAIRLNPEHAVAHYYLGLTLRSLGRLKEAQASLRRAHELGLPQPSWTHPSAEKVKEIDSLVASEQRLAAMLRGDVPLEPTQEMIDLCVLTRRHAAAARLCAEAFRKQPALADDRTKQHRFNAARAAVLAAAGKGEVADLDEEKRTHLRRQALAWLRADLEAYGELFESENPADRRVVAARLRHWKKDADLETVRRPDLVQALPEAEGAEWKQFWREVEALAAGPFRLTPMKPAWPVEILKIQGKRITVRERKSLSGLDTLIYGPEITLLAAGDLKVEQLVPDPKARKTNREPVEGGLKNEVFMRIMSSSNRRDREATITVNADNGLITDILLPYRR
jgi:tetratricopeptide (TPR) repeat protein